MFNFQLPRLWSRRLSDAAQPIARLITRTDLVRDWSWIRAEPFGSNAENAAARTVNWFIPPPSRGSGGHTTLFRFVRYLEIAGFECRIIICNDYAPPPAEHTKANINAWFCPLKAQVYYHPQQDIPPATISVATGWQTAYPVKAFRGTLHRCYFVQDYEPWFYSPSSVSVFAEDTYRFGFYGITAGDWLQQKLHREYGMTTRSFSFSYDRDVYKQGRKRDDTPRIFYYARPPTARRAFELGVLVLDEFARRHPEAGIILAGWDLSEYHLRFPCLKAGLISVAELADVYTQCDAGLVVSLSNLSLLPLEMMACGCVVVSNRGPNVEWLLNNDIALLAEPQLDALVAGLEKAVYDEAYRKGIAANALQKAEATNWDREGSKVAAMFERLHNTGVF
jgi:glycosyltransferase involved in cell wall biosynthesis